jgi:hypothetical protein
VSVRLVKPWQGEPVGKVLKLERLVAIGLIREGIATDLGNVDMRGN